MKLKPTLKYQLREILFSAAIFLLVNLLIVLIFFLLAWKFDPGHGYYSFNGFAIAAAVYALVAGIMFPRQFLRTGVQMGTSRRTVFCGLLITGFVVVLILALCGEAGLAASMYFSWNQFIFSDLYAMIYLDGIIDSHFAAILFNTTLLLCGYGFGLFCTFYFWRLRNRGMFITLLFCVAVPWLCFLLRHHLAPVTRLLERLTLACLDSSVTAMLVFLILAVFFTVISWLLIRRLKIQGYGHS